MFRVALRLNDYSLHENCKLVLRVYGRGVPRRLGSSGFDSYLRRKGAVGFIRLSRRYHLAKKTCGPPGFRLALKNRVGDTLRGRGRLSDSARSAALGLLFGGSGFLRGDFKRKAARLNILHLFAASGLHLAIFYGCLFWPLSRLLGRAHPAALFLPLGPCAFYLWLLGFPVSLSRAFFFLLSFALKSLIQRELTRTDYLSNTAILLLLIMPRELVSLSGAFSFGAVAGILFFQRPLALIFPRKGGRPGEFLRTQVSLGLGATLLTVPVQIGFFGGYSFFGVIANTCLTPLAGLMLPLLYSSLGIETIFPAWAADGFWLATRFLLEVFVRGTEALAPYALYYRFADLTNLPVAAGAALLLLLLVFARPRSRPGSERPRGALRLAFYGTIFLLAPGGAFLLDAWKFLVWMFSL